MEKECSLCCGSRPGPCSCPALHLWSAVRGSCGDQGEGPARFHGCPRPPGAHRGALCGLRLGERRQGSEGRVRAARSPPPPGEGSGRAAAAPQARALGAQPADAVWVHGTHDRLSGAGSPAATVTRAPHRVGPAFPRRRPASSTRRRNGRAVAGRGTLRSSVPAPFPPVPLCARPQAQPQPAIPGHQLPGRSYGALRRSTVNPRALEVVEGDPGPVWLRGRQEGEGACKLSCSLTL